MAPWLAILLLPCPESLGDELRPPGLPAPTGPHPVGTTTFHLTDRSRTDAHAAGENRFRELMVQVWYPADGPNGAAMAPYLTERVLLGAMKQEKYLDLKPEVLDSWAGLGTHSAPGAAIAAGPPRLPLLLFSHGVGVSRSNYTSITEDLASHGYVVAAIDHPYLGLTVLPDRRVLSLTPEPGGPGPASAARRVEAMARDAVFVADALLDRTRQAGRFADHIDPDRVGVLGHSLGGAAALEACRAGGRFKACADLDGDAWGKVEAEGVGRPFLVLLNEPAESRRPPVAVREQRDKAWADLIAKRETAALVVKIGSTTHFSFSDLPLIVPQATMAKNGATIEPRRGLEIITRVLRAFFSQYLGDGKEEAVELVAKRYPELTLAAFKK